MKINLCTEHMGTDRNEHRCFPDQFALKSLYTDGSSYQYDRRNLGQFIVNIKVSKVRISK